MKLTNEDNIIELRRLIKEFDGQVIFKDLNFDVKKSEIFVILGRSGAGKSTLLNILSKLDKDYGGDIIYSEDLYINKKIPFPVVFQEFDQLLPWYTVKKNIILPLKIKTADEKVMEIIDFVGLSNDLNKYPSALSGGMKQRAAIARALITDGDIIFMDEPFGSLDFAMRKNLQNLIIEIKRRFKKSIFFITHDIEEAVYIADRIMLYKDRDYEIIDMSKIDKKNAQSFEKMKEHIKNQLTL